MGSGSTIAAAEAIGCESVGVEIDNHYFTQAKAAIPRLARLYPHFLGAGTEFDVNYGTAPVEDTSQLDFALAERPANPADGAKPKASTAAPTPGKSRAGCRS
jgi:hypothetical protein